MPGSRTTVGPPSTSSLTHAWPSRVSCMTSPSGQGLSAKLYSVAVEFLLVPTSEIDLTAQQLRFAVGQLVRRVRAETAAGGGLPVPQAAVLGWLDRVGPMSTSELAAAQSVRHQSTARVVGQLVDLQMVRLSPHPDDGRKVLVSLASRGRR